MAADLAAADGDTLETLLAERPRVERVFLERGSLLRLGLDVPGAISFARSDGWGAFGVFDPRHRSLAVFHDGALLVFGGDDARERLLSWAATAPSIESLRFELLPPHADVPSGALAILDREHHRIVVWDA